MTPSSESTTARATAAWAGPTAPAGPVFEPMTRSMLPSPTSDSLMKKSARGELCLYEKGRASLYAHRPITVKADRNIVRDVFGCLWLFGQSWHTYGISEQSM
jgi:hypothetical protein